MMFNIKYDDEYKYICYEPTERKGCWNPSGE